MCSLELDLCSCVFFRFGLEQLATSVILQKPQGKMGIAKISNDIDLLHPPVELEKQKHKLKRLVPSPDSTFLDVKCQGCFQITTIFSHSQTVVTCPNCQQVLCQPTGGRAKLTEGCSFRVKEKAMMVLG